MRGETDLKKLLKCMDPELDERRYIFITYDTMSSPHSTLNYWAAIQEKEGMTYIIPVNEAKEKGIPSEPVFRKITLHVYSSLEAVGLTAVVATELASHAISANVVAGYYHDHIFVPEAKAEEAFAILQRLSQKV